MRTVHTVCVFDFLLAPCNWQSYTMPEQQICAGKNFFQIIDDHLKFGKKQNICSLWKSIIIINTISRRSRSRQKAAYVIIVNQCTDNRRSIFSITVHWFFSVQFSLHLAQNEVCTGTPIRSDGKKIIENYECWMLKLTKMKSKSNRIRHMRLRIGVYWMHSVATDVRLNVECNNRRHQISSIVNGCMFGVLFSIPASHPP